MTILGLEIISEFENFRKASGFKPEQVADLPESIEMGDALLKKLLSKKHYKRFYKKNDECEELDLRDASLGGNDNRYADNVDLFFILTHGSNNGSRSRLAYNVNKNDWHGYSSTWRLGNIKLKWLLIWGCDLISLNNVLMCWDLFQGLHIFCGSYGDMWTSKLFASDIGKNIGENLTDGNTVANAWLDGVTYPTVNNHPLVVSMENRAIWNDGDPFWELTTMNLDHLPEHGTKCPEIIQPYWLSYMYQEYYVRKRSEAIRPPIPLTISPLTITIPAPRKKSKRKKLK